MIKNKVMLITGSARRLGAAMVRYFHEEGFNIVLHYRNSKEEAKVLAQQLNTCRSNSVNLLQADFNAVVNYEELLHKALKPWGRLDCLINNASSFYPTKLGKITEEQWLDLFASNAKAPLFLSQAALPYLQLTNGNIVNIIDIHGQKPLKDHAVYCMAKASLSMLTLALAKECAPKVRVNAVAPGTIMWPEGVNELDEALKSAIVEKVPLHKQGKAQDIIKAVAYLLQSEYVTGQILTVDGGRSIKY